MTFVLILLAIVVLFVGYGVLQYNGLVSVRNRIENGWAQIEVQLKRRYDLIPNLVETVKGYASHEKGTLDAVIAARNAAMGATGVAGKAAGHLVDHDFRVGSHEAESLRPGCQNPGSHRRRLSDANRADRGSDALHGVDDGDAIRDAAAGTVDVEVDACGRVVRLQVQQLGDHPIRRIGRDGFVEKDDPLLQQNAGTHEFNTFVKDASAARRRFRNLASNSSQWNHIDLWVAEFARIQPVR